MNFLKADQVAGDRISLAVTHKGHMKGITGSESPDDGSGSGFGNLVTKAINGANDAVKTSSELTEQYIINPDSVDVHDVTIAMAEANLAVSLTKSVVDNALKAYREIINIR